MVIVIGSVIIAGAVGAVLALLRAGRGWALGASVAMFCLSILITYWDDLLRDRTAWASNLVEGVLHTGLLSLVLNALPVFLVYALTRVALDRRAKESSS